MILIYLVYSPYCSSSEVSGPKDSYKSDRKIINIGIDHPANTAEMAPTIAYTLCLHSLNCKICLNEAIGASLSNLSPSSSSSSPLMF